MSSRQIHLALLISCLLGVESIPSHQPLFHPPTYPARPISQQDSSLGVVGGNAVNITEVPFMARYRALNNPYFCGAAIIHTRFVLSSATCRDNLIDIIPYKHTYVTVGTDKAYSHGQSVFVQESYIHPFYKLSKFRFDIAILKLAHDLKWNERVQPIALAKKDFKIPEGAMFDVLGFGAYDADYKMPKYLQKVSIPYIPPEECETYSPLVNEYIICAGSEEKGSYLLDDGGPLVYKDMLLGVHSFVMDYGEKTHESIYTSIPALHGFITTFLN